MSLWAWFTVDGQGVGALVQRRVAPWSSKRSPLVYDDLTKARSVTSATDAMLAARGALRAGAPLQLLRLKVAKGEPAVKGFS